MHIIIRDSHIMLITTSHNVIITGILENQILMSPIYMCSLMHSYIKSLTLLLFSFLHINLTYEINDAEELLKPGRQSFCKHEVDL